MKGEAIARVRRQRALAERNIARDNAHAVAVENGRIAMQSILDMYNQQHQSPSNILVVDTLEKAPWWVLWR